MTRLSTSLERLIRGLADNWLSRNLNRAGFEDDVRAVIAYALDVERRLIEESSIKAAREMDAAGDEARSDAYLSVALGIAGRIGRERRED